MMLSADPPDVSRRFRERLGLRLPLISDEQLVTATHYDLPISYRSPRAFTYPNGFNQPAALAYHGSRQVFRWIQRPAFWNLQGASLRPPPRRVLRVMRRAVRAATRSR